MFSMNKQVAAERPTEKISQGSLDGRVNGSGNPALLLTLGDQRRLFLGLASP